MCELIKDNSAEIKAENEAILLDILAEYGLKNDDRFIGKTSSKPEAEDSDLGTYECERNDSIYSTEELYTPQEMMAVVFLGTN